MKIKLLSLVLVISSLFSFGQSDTTLVVSDTINKIDSVKTIKEIRVFGIRPGISRTTILDSTRCLINGGSDPFFVLNREVPNVISQSDNGTQYGYSYIRMRGMDQTRINFTLNGIPMNEMEDQGIYFSNIPGFYNNISKMDVVRGVGTSKYGTTSLVGSVDMETKSSLIKEFNGQFGMGSFETNSYNLNYSSGLIGKISFSASASYISTEGFRERSGTDGYTYFGQFGYHTKNNIVKFLGFIGNTKNDLSYIPADRESLVQNYRVNFNSTSDKDKFGQNFASVNWTKLNVRNAVVNSSVYFNNVNGYYDVMFSDVARYGIESYQGGLMSNVIWRKKRWSTNLGGNYNAYQRNHTLNYLDTLRYSNFGNKQGLILYSRFTYNINEYSLFGDIQYRGVDFKYTDENGSSDRTKWNFFNPKVGIKRTKENNESWASFGRTSREVTRSDLFDGNDNVYLSNGIYSDYLGESNLNSPNVYQIIPNTSPEIVNNLEIGYKRTFNGFLISSNFYYMDISNERIIIGIDGISGLPIRQIANKSYRRGVEFDATYKYSKWTFRTNGSYLNAKITKSAFGNGESSFSPKFTMNNFINYGTKYKFGINGIFVTSMYLNNEQIKNLSTDPYYVVNLTSEIPVGKVSINLLINNVFNSKYLLPAGVLSGVGQYYPGAGRNYFINFKFVIG